MVAFFIQNTKKILVLPLIFYLSLGASGQVINCFEYLNKNPDIEEIRSTPELLPVALSKLEYDTALFENIRIYVEFVVDTTGNVHCVGVVKGESELMNAKALEIIENTRFSPAMYRKKKVIAQMVLPVIFGELPKKK